MKITGLMMGVALLCATGCASLGPREPYATLDDSYAPKAALNIERAEVMGLDGKLFVRQRPLRLDPGVHIVLVRSLKADLRHGPKPDTLNLYLNAQACRAYTVAAKHECSTCAKWAPAIIAMQDIPGCKGGSSASGNRDTAPAPPPSGVSSEVPPLP